MKLVYVTAGMGLHVKAISDAYYKILGADFTFIWTRQPKNNPNSIHKHAETGLTYERTYIFHAWKSPEADINALKIIDDADVVIFGGASYHYVEQRIKDKKITFHSSERWFKRPFYTISPKGWLSLYKTIIKPQYKNYYLLALSAYCANDCAIMHAFKNRVYEFGYLVPIDDYDVVECVKQKRCDVLEIMWCARFIDWKHPELVTGLAKRLVDNGIMNFHINMVGATSPLQDKAKSFIHKNELEKHVTIIEGLPNAETRALMKSSNIFLITSDRKEGWGAVLNEAMGAGCAIVASNQIGSTPFLLKQRQNGLIFKSKSIDSLYDNVVTLVNDQQLRETLAVNAYSTITTEWSADNVAKRFIALAESILQGHPIEYPAGPCSLSHPCNEKEILKIK